MVVVLPAPFTPTMKMTRGPLPFGECSRRVLLARDIAPALRTFRMRMM